MYTQAKYIGKTYGQGYDRNSVYLEYEYKGYRYTVMQNYSRGNEPLSWQHKSEQSRIDMMLSAEQTNTPSSAEEGLDLFYEYQ